MIEQVSKRFVDLITEGERLLHQVPSDKHGPLYWVRNDDIPVFQAWLTSSLNLIKNVVPPRSHFFDECQRAINHKDLQGGIPSHIFQKVHGILVAAKKEWEHGFLTRIEYIVAASTFDDFLDQADSYHKSNKKTEASVLASAVLEDTVKKIGQKWSIQTQGLSLDALIDELVKTGILTAVKAKRIKGSAAIRNKALHAEWDQFDIRDVGDLIKTTRELVEDYL